MSVSKSVEIESTLVEFGDDQSDVQVKTQNNTKGTGTLLVETQHEMGKQNVRRGMPAGENISVIRTT